MRSLIGRGYFVDFDVDVDVFFVPLLNRNALGMSLNIFVSEIEVGNIQ